MLLTEFSCVSVSLTFGGPQRNIQVGHNDICYENFGSTYSAYRAKDHLPSFGVVDFQVPFEVGGSADCQATDLALGGRSRLVEVDQVERRSVVG